MDFQQKTVPEEITTAVQGGRSFLRALGEQASHLPRFNDADNGYALSAHLQLSWQGDTPKAPLTTFADGGFTCVSLGEGSRLFLDHGPLGNGPLYAHGHADALSLCVEVEGFPLAVDPGTYMYTGGLPWRTYFRSTEAHNTVRVDGQDQAQQATPFQWTKPYRAELLKSKTDSEGTVFLWARHHGYASRQVIHSRLVICIPGDMIIIRDVLEGLGEHTLDLHWHFGAPVTQTEDGFQVSPSGQPVRVTLEGGDISTLSGETSPVSGWLSKRYGQKQPLTTLRVSHQGILPHLFTTIMYLSENRTPAAPYLKFAESWTKA